MTTSPQSDTKPVFDAIDRLGPLVRSAADSIDRDRRLPEGVVAALRGSGVHRLLLPRELGGFEANPLLMIDAIERIAAEDASAAWCTAVAVSASHFGGYLDPAGAREVFRDPDMGNAAMFAPLGTASLSGNTLTITGRWPFTSNCLHSEWIGLGVHAATASGEPMDTAPDGTRITRLAFVPRAEVTIHDTWKVSGMRGTGSNDVSVESVKVPLERSFSFTGRPWPDSPLFRMPVFNVLTPALTAVALGVARGALADVGARARDGARRVTGKLTDDPFAMADLALADANVAAARALLRERLSEVWELAMQRGETTVRHRSGILMACMHAMTASANAVGAAYNISGAKEIYEGSRLLRARRDLDTAQQHVLFSRGLQPTIGRIVAGMAASAPPFF